MTDLLRSHGIAWEEGGHSDSLSTRILFWLDPASARAKPGSRRCGEGSRSVGS